MVGSLTHTALRYWRFPDGEGFTDFLRPFALEAGLTDAASIDIALERVARLLSRFQAHALYTRLSTAERHHELPFSVTVDGQLRRGVIDLLFRSSAEAAWTIAEFKIDRLPAGVDLKVYAEQKGYDRQVATYQAAVAQQAGASPPALVVFMNVGQSIKIFNIEG